MTTTGSVGPVRARSNPARPDPAPAGREAGAQTTIDLTGQRPRVTGLPSRGAPPVLRSSPRVPTPALLRDLELRAPARRIHLGHDVESPLVWQRVAESVRGLAPGDVVVLDVRDLGSLPGDLVDFLRHAVNCAALRGGTLSVDPPYGPLRDVVQLAPLWPDFRRDRSYTR